MACKLAGFGFKIFLGSNDDDHEEKEEEENGKKPIANTVVMAMQIGNSTHSTNGYFKEI